MARKINPSSRPYKPIALARQYKNAYPPGSHVPEDRLERAKEVIDRADRMISQRSSRIKNSSAGRQINKSLAPAKEIEYGTASRAPLRVSSENTEVVTKHMLSEASEDWEASVKRAEGEVGGLGGKILGVAAAPLMVKDMMGQLNNAKKNAMMGNKSGVVGGPLGGPIQRDFGAKKRKA